MPRRLSASASRQLAADLAGPPADPDDLTSELATWLVANPRFRGFADAYRDKIRKKLRLARDAESRLDVRAELLVAHRLLADRNIELAFEPGTAPAGGPDFSVTYRGGRSFTLEVTRPRRVVDDTASRAILAKLRQLPTGSANVLLLVLPPGARVDLGVRASVRDLRARADAKDEAFFTQRRFAGTRDFYERFLRLSAVITWDEAGRGSAWTNASARLTVDDRGLRACLRALGPRG